jgi:hypothetical protein
MPEFPFDNAIAYAVVPSGDGSSRMEPFNDKMYLTMFSLPIVLANQRADA